VSAVARSRVLLAEGWTLRATGGPIPAKFVDLVVPATVPGCVHTDLLAAGLIPDPYLDNNEAALAWIGLIDWQYETTVDAPAPVEGARHELVFEGLDTVATVRLDDEVIAEVANQHRTHRLDVTELLTPGAHRLTVSFRSPVRYANAQSLELGVRPRPYPLPYEAIRKSACNFGWDWGIATFTSGLWRPAALESWSVARFDDVRVVATPEGDGGRIEVTATLARTSDEAVEVTVTAAQRAVSVTVPAGAREARIRLDLDTVERWWPVGHGPAALTDVAVTLKADGVEIDRVDRRVGFRTVRWDMTPDADGTPFTLVVNDRPIWVKGANWIPDDALPVRVDRDRYEERLRQAVAGNLNLIRVWGGGIYESDDFYALCDELGLLAWQDFLFACAAYPEEEPLRSEIEAEARDNIARLAHHASLVLLTGNNENLWGYEEWGWKLRLDGRTWGSSYYHELLPGLVSELAPHVPYSPGSPFSPGDEPANAEDHGTMHIWDLWNQRDWPHYREYRPRFVAEFGWQGPPTWSTLVDSIHDDPLTPESPGMLVHQKAMEGNVKLTTGLVPHYRMPDAMEDWHWAMQLNQANAITCALEHFRASAPRTMGAVVWQFNDCWPVTSWAAVDGNGRPKPLFHALQNAFAARHISIQPDGDALVAVISNDTDDEWSGALALSRLDYGGTPVASESAPLTVAPRSLERVAVPAAVATATTPAAEFVIAQLDDVRGIWFFGEPRDSALPPADVSVEVTGTAVTITAHSLVRDLTLLVDKIDPGARVDRGLLTLFPGESTTLHVTGAAITAEAIRDARVLRSANELVAR
jgi:beta-mannosidase